MRANPETMLSRAKLGDQGELGRLLEWLCVRLRRRIARKIPADLKSQIDADDLLQQSCVDALVAFDKASFSDVHSVTAWFQTIANRHLIDTVRSLRAYKRGGDKMRITANSSSTATDLLTRLSVISMTASRAALHHEAIISLRSALERLPDHYRYVVERLDLNGEPVEEIANSLDRSIGAVFMIRAPRTPGNLQSARITNLAVRKVRPAKFCN